MPTQLLPMNEVTYVIGQSLSLVAVMLGFIAYQMKTSRAILAVEIFTALVFASHYFLIGALTATALNFVGMVQCVAFYWRDKKGSNSPVIPVVFTVLMVVTSILTWGEWYSVFIMLGLTAYSITMALHSAKIIRYTNIFFKSPMCLAYNALAFSVGGIIYECAVLTSSVVKTVTERKTAEGEKHGEI